MNGELVASLAVLALIDSTSIGTLFIPVWLLLRSERGAVGRILAYLATIAGFYFVVGGTLMLGAGSLAEPLSRVLDSTVALSIQLAIGVGLFALSFRFDPKRRPQDAVPRSERWRARVADRSSSSVAGLMGLALLAGVLELATMLPYLGAIGLLTTSTIGWSMRGLLLGAYVVVMVVPALALLGIRIVARDRIDPWLERLSRWMTNHADEAIPWVLGIVGFLVARDAAARLLWPQLF
jgi:hypothetical protein